MMPGEFISYSYESSKRNELTRSWQFESPAKKPPFEGITLSKYRNPAYRPRTPKVRNLADPKDPFHLSNMRPAGTERIIFHPMKEIRSKDVIVTREDIQKDYLKHKLKLNLHSSLLH